jgi:hypothetical protein
MKLGIPLLVIGVLLLVLSIPFSVVLIVGGVNRLSIGDISGGFLAWAPVIGVLTGFILTTIGATRVFKD